MILEKLKRMEGFTHQEQAVARYILDHVVQLCLDTVHRTDAFFGAGRCGGFLQQYAADLLLRPGLCRSVPGFRPVHGRSTELAAEEKELAAESDEAGRHFIDCHGIVDEYPGGGVHF